MIKQKLLKDLGLANKIAFVEPEKAKEEDLLRVHTDEYINKLKNGNLSQEDILTLELPYSKELVLGSMLCCGGTIAAVSAALKDGLGIHLGGGFHHSFPDHGEGFCVLNDICVAIKKYLENKEIKKAFVVDCDLHQGNGTAYAFQNDDRVFTFSIHQENNYPFHKPKSDMDIGLADRTKDKEYLAHLENNIPKIISDFKPDLIMYVAGADPYEHDQIGNLGLTKTGLRNRDYFIYSQAKNYQIPVAVVLAGGYAKKQEDTVDIQFATIKTGVEMFNARNIKNQISRLRQGYGGQAKMNIKKSNTFLYFLFLFLIVGFLFLVFKSEANDMEKIKLPEPKLKSSVSLEETISKRRSVRNYSSEELTIEQISQLLWACQGITDPRGLRAAPSAGALYPLEIYLVKNDGVYHYLPDGHMLEKKSGKNIKGDLTRVSWNQRFIETASIDIVICAVYERVASKYGERGVKYTDIEIGHAAENVHLQAVSLGLSSVPVGAFDDGAVSRILGLPNNEKPICIIPVGYKKR